MEEQQNIGFKKVQELWIESSNKDFRAMNNLVKTKDFHWSLFIGHLVIEKLLKAYYVKTHNDYPPFTHDLLRIAKSTNLEVDDEQSDWLDTITTFNINVRYDNYKKEFYRKCTPTFTRQWINKIKELRRWIKSKL